MNTAQPDAYDLAQETEASRQMLTERIPARMQGIYRFVDENSLKLEEWHRSLFIKLVRGVEHNCQELLGTFDQARLPAAAWIARNMLELWVWAKYCVAARDNAWRFHTDALRDFQGISELHQKLCLVMGIEDDTSALIKEKIAEVAAERFALDDIDSAYLAVSRAANADGVNLGGRYSLHNRFLSKFAHPTAGLLIGIMHQEENGQELQAVCTTQGVYFAAQTTLAVGAFLGLGGL